MTRQYRTTSNADSRALTVRLHNDSYEALEVAAGLLRVSMASLVEEAWEYYRGSKVFRAQGGRRQRPLPAGDRAARRRAGDTP